jgi:hypothetical protein
MCHAVSSSLLFVVRVTIMFGCFGGNFARRHNYNRQRRHIASNLLPAVGNMAACKSNADSTYLVADQGKQHRLVTTTQ